MDQHQPSGDADARAVDRRVRLLSRAAELFPSDTGWLAEASTDELEVIVQRTEIAARDVREHGHLAATWIDSDQSYRRPG